MKKLLVFLTVFVMFFTYTLNICSAESTGQIKVQVNGKYIAFDVNPIIESGRTIVPVRGIFEAIDASVKWFGESRTVVVIKDNMIVLLQIDSKMAYVNQSTVELDVPARIINSRTFVPLRFIAESIGAKVDWDKDTRTVFISTKDQTPTSGGTPTSSPAPTSSSTPTPLLNFDGKIGTLMGASVQSAVSIFGEPDRIDLSKYGFDWYIYNGDLSKYIQIGIENDKIVGIYTNSSDFKLSDSIEVGTVKSVVGEELGSPLSYIQKGNTRYRMDNSGEQEIFDIDKSFYATIFYDIHNDNKVTSFLLIDHEIEQSFEGYYGEQSEELRISYEKEIFDLANTVRVRYGKVPLEWNDEVAEVARAHSEDMILNDFFDHDNLEGESPFDRMEKAGIEFRSASENIAQGQMDGIYAHEAWMNSAGHRSNILGDFTRLGVGVYIDNDRDVSYTQNFYTPRRQ